MTRQAAGIQVADVPQRNLAGRLAGKVCVVSGAGSVGYGWSIGNAVAALFAREGALIFAIDHKAKALEPLRGVVEGMGGRFSGAVTDATQLEQVEKAIAQCEDQYGRIDVLYNNVGGGKPGGVVEMTAEAWRENLDFNLTSAFNTSKCVLPVMRRQKSGALVHLSSAAGNAYQRQTMVAYAAAKAGLQQMSKVIAMQHVEQGIRSNCVIAGMIETAAILRRVTAGFGGDRLREVMALRNQVIPMGRSGEVWDIAYAALYLASDESKYVTATEILVDGGLATPQLGSYIDMALARDHAAGRAGAAHDGFVPSLSA
ncbi:SDR family NAD(P)-dependent oxidoreductase [Ottowia sp. VDI28]|uniref:SDR family NAD(P)-dependent oxidoreductase n=1 Tax=Ottowia sp. VDI28 TaxID=3133968 RepID=UPI003C30B9AD